MTLQRAPITRPSVAGVVSDNYDRIRVLEAAQSLPYCWGRIRFTWESDSELSWEPGSLTDCYLQWTDISGSDVSELDFITTDESIFSQVPLTPATGNGIYVVGGGLFWWTMQVNIGTDEAFGDLPFTQVIWWDPETASYPILPEVQSYLPMGIDGGAHGYPFPFPNGFQDTWTGVRSVSGLRNDVDNDSPEPLLQIQFTGSLSKGTPTNSNLDVVADIIIVRWSPIGMFLQA